MAEVIWIELLSRQGHMTARFRCAGPVLTIGRSYRNDVVLDDPAVAPEHLRVTLGADGALIAEALDKAQGFAIAGEPRDRSLIDGDTVLRIGHTLLRVRDADYPVAAAAMPALAASRHAPWLALALLIVATVGFDALTSWLSETAEPKATRYIATLAGLGGVALMWGAVWAVFSRIFSGQARFGLNLAIGLGGILGYMVYHLLAAGLAFAFSSQTIADDAFIGIWILLGAVCFCHLHAISATRPAVKAGILAALAASAIALQLANQFDLHTAGQQGFARPLLPPAFRLARVKSEDRFFADIGALKPKLDADRTAAP